MWIIIPAISLALINIAGDNVGVVPDAAFKLAEGIYPVTILAYIVFGSMIAGISAWIGARSGYELGVLAVRKFGCFGKKLLAASILGISIPASALTGGVFCGWLVNNLTGLPYLPGVLICITVFSLLAAGYFKEMFLIASYVSMLLVPAIFILIFVQGIPRIVLVWPVEDVDWSLVFALVSYNACGMRPVLVTEAAAYLTKRGYGAVGLAMIAKIVEGLVTICLARLAVAADVSGPLAITGIATKLLGISGGMVFNGILLCVFITTMTPAMLMNARQTACLTGWGFWSSLGVATLAVYLMTFLKYSVILNIMSGTGLVMVAYILYIAYFIYRYGTSKR